MAQDTGQTVDVLVTGAGMAGLIAAAGLQRAGRRGRAGGREHRVSTINRPVAIL